MIAVAAAALTLAAGCGGEKGPSSGDVQRLSPEEYQKKVAEDMRKAGSGAQPGQPAAPGK